MSTSNRAKIGGEKGPRMPSDMSRISVWMPKDVARWLFAVARRDCRTPFDQALWYIMQAKRAEDAAAQQPDDVTQPDTNHL